MTITTGAPGILDAQKLALDELLKKHYDLMSVDVALDDHERIHHRTYIYLVMALIHHFWNGNRRGVTGTYHYRDDQKDGCVWSGGKEYLGHNIAAIAVDREGDVIDFDFNHNEIFKSSMEHAEARLLRRLFSLTGLRANWSQRSDNDCKSWSERLGDDYESTDPRPDDPQSTSEKKERFSTTLSNITIYTSLEPCAQCAGMMALARVANVVYLQQDPGAARVANILYNLKPYGAAAKPIPASACGVDYGKELNEAYEGYKRRVTDPLDKAFYIPPDKGAKEDRSTSLTTFLCTDFARNVYEKGAKAFLQPSSEEYAEDPKPRILQIGSASVTDFFEYAVTGGHRGTPH